MITAITGALVAALALGHVTERLDHIFYDTLVGFDAPRPSDKVLLVAIDDRSIAALGRWPWPRVIHARMLEQLAKAPPAAIAYDVLFTEPGSSDGDGRLAHVETTLGTVALPVLFETPGRDGHAVDTIMPIPPIGTAARAIGHVALLPDSDGIARSLLLAFPAAGHNWAHLMEWAYRIALHHPSAAWQRQEWKITIPFQPTSGGFRTISFASVLAGEVPAAFIRSKIVLVGVTATGLGDRYQVPMRSGGPISGLEVQANLLNTLLTDSAVVTPGWPLWLGFSLLPSLALLISFWWLTPSRALLAAVALIGVALSVPVLLLALAGIWLPPTPGLIGLLLVYPLWGWRRLQAVDRAITEELVTFTSEPTPIPLNPQSRGPLDPIGGQTARLRDAIAAMRDLRRLVSDTIESVTDPLLVTELDDCVLLANQPALALFGAVNGCHAAGLLGTASETSIVADALPQEVAIGAEVFSLRRSPLRDSAGRQRGWILHLIDITARRTAEREREAALEFLSHDMRSPQSSIITLIERHRASLANETITGRITALARRTLTLADTFVELARLDVTRFEPEDLDLGDVLTEAADDLWPQASSRSIRIELDGIDEPHFMLGERETLRRAFVNVLDNAVKFSTAGASVRCTLVTDGAGKITCTIDDAGPGIAHERRADLFKRYGHRRTAPGSRHSAGLGLAYVGAAIARHGGTIDCTELEPSGTRFVVRFTALD